jgi:hypothetical protein
MAKRKSSPVMHFLVPALLLVSQATHTFGQKKNLADRYVDAYKQYLGAACPLGKDAIKHFVYFARDRQAIRDHSFLKVARFEGAQIMYAWRELEPEKDKYDFTIIREDYEYLKAHGKKLFIQFQDGTFSPQYKAVPTYLLAPEYDGGTVAQLDDNGKVDGWVAKRWNPAVQKRFALLMLALGKEFDGKIEGINLQESAIGVTAKVDASFTPEKYVQGLKANMLSLKNGFPQSTTMQYANFMPDEWLPYDDKGYLRAIYAYGEQIGVGLGGPDLMYTRKGNLNHTVALMHESDYTVPLGIAIQDGNYVGTTASNKVVANRKNLVPVLHAFAKDFLKVDYMFWVAQEPYFSEDVVPCFGLGDGGK